MSKDEADLNPIIWKDNALFLLDQRKIPQEEVLVEIRDLDSCYNAIKDMIVRGAPCIGHTAIWGMALWLIKNPQMDLSELNKAASFLKSARPTAVNLIFEVDRCVELIKNAWDKNENPMQTIIDFGHQEMNLAYKRNLFMAKFALSFLDEITSKKKFRIQTHCNTGALACGQLGTALGVISYMHKEDRLEKVWVDETRPYMQGSRLTAYELKKMNAPYEIVVEGAASYLMSNNLVDAIYVGADRIAANGDTANKIGTATLATVANYYKVPFFIVAPLSSFDPNIKTGKNIPIEFRDPEEILSFRSLKVAPDQGKALNPSFDVTDNSLITGIICETGVIRPPYIEGIYHALREQGK